MNYTTEQLYRLKKVRDLLMEAGKTGKSTKKLQKVLGLSKLRNPQKALQRILSELKVYDCEIKRFRSDQETHYRLTKLGSLASLDKEIATDYHKIQHIRELLGVEELQELHKKRIIQIEQSIDFLQFEPNAMFILQAIKNKENILFDYQKLTDTKPIYRIVCPYILREYDNEWHLIGLEMNRGGEIWEEGWLKFYNLSKITNLQYSQEPYHETEDIYDKDRFLHCYGAFINEEEGTVEDVILTFLPAYRKQLERKPMHSTQEILPSEAGEFRIKLRIHVGHYGTKIHEYNQELLQDLAAYGRQVKVLDPPDLANALQKYFQEAANQYN